MWCVYVADCDQANSRSFRASKFAGDITLYKFFRKNVPFPVVYAALAVAQGDMHGWGRDNRIAFDASKGQRRTIDGYYGEGECVRLSLVVLM